MAFKCPIPKHLICGVGGFALAKGFVDSGLSIWSGGQPSNGADLGYCDDDVVLDRTDLKYCQHRDDTAHTGRSGCEYPDQSVAFDDTGDADCIPGLHVTGRHTA